MGRRLAPIISTLAAALTAAVVASDALAADDKRASSGMPIVTSGVPLVTEVSSASAAADQLLAADARIAGDQLPRAVGENPLLWSTINVCDTVQNPDAIGIRGSMPGNGDRAVRMYMRFQVQYYSRSERRWKLTGVGGDSGFVYVGSGRWRAREAGRTFKLAPPQRGQSYYLRGLVTFEWRKDGAVVRRARRVSTAGHRGTRGSDPPGFSAARCRVWS